MLIAAATLDLTRCSLVLMTFRHVAPTVGLVAAGIGAAVVSVTAARGYRAGQRWAAWAAVLTGIASAPQASASGFHNPYTIPDVATAALGVLLTVAILATVGRTGTPVHPPESPCAPPRSAVRPGQVRRSRGRYLVARLQIGMSRAGQAQHRPAYQCASGRRARAAAERLPHAAVGELIVAQRLGP